MVFEVVCDLFFSTCFGDGGEAFDGVCHFVGVEDDAAVDVSGGASGGLDEGAF